MPAWCWRMGVLMLSLDARAQIRRHKRPQVTTSETDGEWSLTAAPVLGQLARPTSRSRPGRLPAAACLVSYHYETCSTHPHGHPAPLPPACCRCAPVSIPLPSSLLAGSHYGPFRSSAARLSVAITAGIPAFPLRHSRRRARASTLLSPRSLHTLYCTSPTRGRPQGAGDRPMKTD